MCQNVLLHYLNSELSLAFIFLLKCLFGWLAYSNSRMAVCLRYGMFRIWKLPCFKIKSYLTIVMYQCIPYLNLIFEAYCTVYQWRCSLAAL